MYNVCIEYTNRMCLTSVKISSAMFQLLFQLINQKTFVNIKAKKKYMCVYCHMSKKSRVGRSGLILIFFFLLSTKPEIVVPGSRIRFRYLIFENSGKMTNYAVFLPSLLSISTKSQQLNK